mgnify:CR=1 FL=1
MKAFICVGIAIIGTLLMGIIYLTPDNSSGSYLLMQRAIPPQPRGGCYAG